MTHRCLTAAVCGVCLLYINHFRQTIRARPGRARGTGSRRHKPRGTLTTESATHEQKNTDPCAKKYRSCTWAAMNKNITL